jgi:diguanylate cyclase (GGDEF)-like protein
MPHLSISPEKLDWLLSIYPDYRKEKPRLRPSPFLKWFDLLENPELSVGILERPYQCGEIVACENDPGDTFYVIRSGRMAVLKGDLQAPIVLAFRETGDILGEMALLGNGFRSATLVAIDAVVLWVVNSDLFYRYLSQNPFFGIDVMSVLSQRLRNSDEERSQSFNKGIEYEEELDELREQIYLDALTGLYNRRYLGEHLQRELLQAGQDGYLVGILMIDLDHFKQVNDTYGHKAGDLVLQALGTLLKGSARPDDLVCRYGGEEFVVCVPRISPAAICERAEQVCARFRELQITCESQVIRATLSVGIAIFPEHGSSVDEVLIHADQALYQAKGQGRNRTIVWSPDAPAATSS